MVAALRRRDLLLSAFAVKASPWFRDVTHFVFSDVVSFREQLAKGIPYWRSVLDVACGTDVFGSQGIAVGDIDNDGRDEIYVCQPGGLPNRLFQFRDDGRAEDITERAGVGILDDTSSALFIDTRNRGLQDLIVLRSAGPVLFLNQGDGRFQPAPEAFRFKRRPQGSFTGMAAADYDGDGLVDIYLCCYIYYQSENQYRYPVPYYDARNGPPNFLFRNTGAGFVDVTEESGIDENNDRYSFAAAWCDYDQDGRPELYVANDFGRNNLYKYDGKRFRDIASWAGVEDLGPGMSAAWFDYNGDGLFDLYVGNMYTAVGRRVVLENRLQPAEAYRRHTKGNTLYRNLGNGRFLETGQAEMGRWAWCSDAYDFDYDGAPEICIACGMITGDRPGDLEEFFWREVVSKAGEEYEDGWNLLNQRIREGDSWNGHEPNVFYAFRQGRYQDHSGESGFNFASDSRAFAFTDFDGDGNIDVILKSRLGPQIRVLRNERGNGRPAVAIRLHGVKSNRDAIGAVVRLGSQVKQVSAGSGYLSQHSKTLYFAAVAQEAEIDWPSGLKQHIAGLAPGFCYAIREGSSGWQRTRFTPRRWMASGEAAGDNTPVARSFRLLEPLTFPPAVQGVRERAILGKYLRDLRRELPQNSEFLTDRQGQLVAIRVADTPLPAQPVPFSGAWIVKPTRNLAKLGAAFYLENLPDAALVYLRDALNLTPNADAANGIGLMFARQGRFEEAREWFQKAIELDPRHVRAINNLGVLYGERRQFHDAIAAFEYGIQVAPNDDTLYLNLGRIYVQMGLRDRARYVMQRLLERNPQSAIARRALEELR
jgi:tetratricopeptide (TPR) repeat protein